MVCAGMLMLTCVLSACGNGNEGGNQSSNVVSISGPAAAITSFVPAAGPVGTEIIVSGNGLNQVIAAKIGSVTATFSIDSATQMRVIVPAQAAGGRIEISTPAGVALSSGNFTLTTSSNVPIPAAQSVLPASVLAGGRISVSGANLDQVSQARLGATVLAIVSRSTTTLVLEIPPGAVSNFLTLVDTGGTARQSSLFVTVLGPMSIASFSRNVIARGQMLTLSGVNLDRATTVIFGGGSSTPVLTRNGGTSVTVAVPGTAASGAVTVSAGGVDVATSSNVLTIVDPIVVTPATYNVSAGAPVVVNGSGLAAVTLVTEGGVPATINSQSATQLVFTPPAGVNCDSILLLSASQDPVFAGTIVLGGGCSLRTASVDFAQVMSQAYNDAFLRIVPAKETWVRAFVVSDFAGVPAPAMRAVGFSGNTPVGSVALNGPVILPVLPANGTVPSSLRDNDVVSYNAELPASWIANGLKVRIEIDSLQTSGGVNIIDSTPPIGGEAAIDVVLVPLISGNNLPIMPSLAEVTDELTRRLPVARGRIRVALRAPYTLTSVTNGVDTSAEWSAAIAELENLRDQEAPAKQYYGMVRPIVSAGIAGIGYLNSVGSSSPALSALGWDATRTDWRRTMVHEFGHNYSRYHAPCGGPASPDPNYPYPGGTLGSTPLFDSIANRVIAPTNQTDIMGYCGGSWFSDYNLREVQRFLEMRPQPALALASAAPADTITISGVIDGSGVRLAPVRAVKGRASSAPSGRNVLRISTRGGEIIERPFEAAEVDHAEGENHFLVSIPDPGEITGIEVLRDGRQLPVATAQVPRPLRAAGAVVSGPWAGAKLNNGKLFVTWNTQATAYATVTLLVNGTRHTLALNADGGLIVVPVSGLPEGGTLEVSLSDGLNARVVTMARP
jgi:IPT/TIG domain